MTDDSAFGNASRVLLRFRCWCDGQIGVVGIDNASPLAVRLLLSDLDEFVVSRTGGPPFRILDRERVGSVKMSEFGGFCDLDLGDLPGYGCARTE
jgi:hypothetical protein